MDIQREIKLYLVKERISQKELSEKTGMSQPKICMSLNGERKLSIDEYSLIIGALNVPADMFIKPVCVGE